MRKHLTFSAKDLTRAVSAFQRYGVVAFTGQQRVSVQQRHDDAVKLLERYLHEAQKHGYGIGKETGFREFVQKDENRFDLNFDDTSDHESREFAASLREHVETTVGHGFLDTILGPGYKRNAQGLVVSKCGAPAQRWHVDSSHLFATPTLPNLPCHFVTVFCPLYQAHKAIGPTEFLPGSQLFTHVLENDEVFDQYPSDDTVTSIQQKAAQEVELEMMQMEGAAGDVIVMDGRLLHRGQANELPDSVRCLTYLSYCRPWYYEWPRSQSETRFLFR